MGNTGSGRTNGLDGILSCGYAAAMPQTTSATGACLCGAVTIKAAQFPLQVGACHCTTCRNWGGGPLLAAACGAEVTIDGSDNISVFNSSEWAERGFCKVCGTHLFYRIKENQHYHLPVGFFPEVAFTLANEVFIDEKPEGYTFANKTDKMTGAQLFAMFAPTS